ncbi:uncharacterized protein TRIREDRAFT_112276 [Trichoderma reesei QM6a]|uniref:Predicted protein n=1 Tax=Hypocrea jecorina (strain QM6a) TaxID=431241 RepID=G0RWN0_HYPJQ|nr:uncharacterized protein TRIREDRAFT_112276 [Trichoderma reesei QM6a]EGR44379.1 predicted protein [Trichoderma reesei QM6a]
MSSSPIVLLVGKHCYKAFFQELNNFFSILLTMVKFKFKFSVFKASPSFFVVYNKATREVKQLILYTYHASHFLYGLRLQNGKVIIIPGEAFCRHIGPMGMMCFKNTPYEKTGALRKHYKECHDLGIISKEPGSHRARYQNELTCL